FGPQTSLSDPGIRGLAAADMNNDGKLDLIGANTGPDGIKVHMGNGSGGFAAGNITSSPAYDVATGDFNRDGKMDIVIVRGDDYATVLLGNGNGLFAPSPILVHLSSGDSVLNVTTADLNK